MSLWLSNIPILLQSLRENDWYITAFPFSFNGHDYVVVFEDLRELDRGSKYYSVNLTFIDMANETRICELPASKETGFRRRQSKDTGFEPAGSLFSCLSG